MKSSLLTVIILVFLYSTPVLADSNGLRRFFKKSDQFLSSYVKGNKVNYQSILSSPEQLNELMRLIADANLQGKPVEECKAFYINAYNLIVIAQIIENFPVDSPHEINGFYEINRYEVSGEMVTLNEIEAILIKKYDDLKCLFALCSGTVGSFPLESFAYKPEKLNKQLNQRVSLIANNDRYIRVKKNSSRIMFSEVFIRCSKITGDKEILNELAEVREEKFPNGYSLEYYPVNRSVNSLQ